MNCDYRINRYEEKKFFKKQYTKINWFSLFYIEDWDLRVGLFLFSG